LEATFQKTHYPDVAVVDRLAQVLNLGTERISIWFQNRRARYKKDRKLLADQNKQVNSNKQNEWVNKQQQYNSNNNKLAPQQYPQYYNNEQNYQQYQLRRNHILQQNHQKHQNIQNIKFALFLLLFFIFIN
jgi:hypothetical protein